MLYVQSTMETQRKLSSPPGEGGRTRNGAGVELSSCRLIRMEDSKAEVVRAGWGGGYCFLENL